MPAYDVERVADTEDLVSGENVFFCATGSRRHLPQGGAPYRTPAAHHPIDRDALEVGHGPDDRGLPPASKLNEYSAIDFTRQQRAIPCPSKP